MNVKDQMAFVTTSSPRALTSGRKKLQYQKESVLRERKSCPHLVLMGREEGESQTSPWATLYVPHFMYYVFTNNRITFLSPFFTPSFTILSCTHFLIAKSKYVLWTMLSRSATYKWPSILREAMESKGFSGRVN
ncbi:hypothetical protein EV361DRAFT_869466 [Lentinula raphanica]|nr:hypothetical protein EV360DRAFT_70457 [Lentinula raphanica]KAJ3819870.1 hypothetical protein F5880DRAFT_1509814 [Lentinula raphanica]KAJ3970207.1 hypothetical protein EV361DRAFT_869466 [Lentinula raphanica]